MLRESYDKISTHLKLLNEDIDKFNLSYDFGLIAAQMEALEGRSEVLSGGLLSPEREELSSRMRFKRRKLDEKELPPPPNLPPLEQIKDRLVSIIDRIVSAETPGKAMKKTLIALIILVAGSGLSGCGPTLYSINVNGYTDPAAPTQLAPGGSFFVIENQKAQNPLLEKEIAGKINKLLTNKGYALTSYDKAQYYLLFSYGVGQETRRQRGHAGLLHLLRLRDRGRLRLARQPLCLWRALLLLLSRSGEAIRPLAADQRGGRQDIIGKPRASSRLFGWARPAAPAPLPISE